MFLQLKRWLAAPIFPGDAEKTLQAKTMNTIGLYYLAALLVAALVYTPFFSTNKMMAWSLLVVLIMIWAINRYIMFRGNLKLAWLGTIVPTWVVFTITVFLSGGIDSPFWFALASAVVIVNLFISHNVGRIFLLASILTSLAMATYEQTQGSFYHYLVFQPISIWFLFVLALLFMYGSASQILKGYKDGLQREQALNQALHQAEAVLSENEARLRTLCENALAGVYIIQEGRFTYVNPSLAQKFGYQPSELIGKEYIWLIHPDDRAQVADIAHRRLRGDRDVDGMAYTIRGLTKTGETRYFEVLGNSVTLANKPALIGNLLDVSELTRSQTLLKAVTDSTIELVWSVDAEHFGLQFWNRGLCELFWKYRGIATEVGNTPEDLSPNDPEFAITWRGFYQRALDEGAFNTEYRLSSLNLVLELNFNVLVRDGQPLGIAVVGKDITEQKLAEEKLRRSEAKFRAVVDNSFDGTVFCDANGIISYRSPSCKKINGYGDEERIGQSIFEVILPDDIERVREYWSHVMQRPEIPQKTVYRILHKDGVYRCVETTSQNLFDNQDIQEVVFTSRDITEQKQYEDSLKIALEEKEILLRELYHRSRNNMQFISSLMALQADQVEDPQVSTVLQEMQTRIQSMALVHQMLYESHNLAKIDLSEYLNDLAQLLAQTYNTNIAQISLVVDCDSVPVDLDVGVPCGLILTELITNSIKHAFPGSRGGEISIRLRRMPDQAIVLEVGDNGAGFPAGFDPRTEGKLGLQTVLALCEQQLRGKVQFVSDSGGVICRMQFSPAIFYQEN